MVSLIIVYFIFDVVIVDAFIYHSKVIDIDIVVMIIVRYELDNSLVGIVEFDFLS